MKYHPATDLLEKFCEAYNNRDLNGIINLFSKRTHLWGTGKDECRSGIFEVETQIKRDWAQTEKGKIVLQSSILNSNEDPFWAAGIYRVEFEQFGKKDTYADLRLTIILTNENQTFKIAHMHASVPDIRLNDGESFPSL